MIEKLSCIIDKSDYIKVERSTSGGFSFSIKEGEADTSSCVILSKEDTEKLVLSLAKELDLKVEVPEVVPEVGDVSYHSFGPNGSDTLYRAIKTESGYLVDIIHLDEEGLPKVFVFDFTWVGEGSVSIIHSYPEGKEKIDSILERERVRLKIEEITDKKVKALNEYNSLSSEYNRLLEEYGKVEGRNGTD